MTYEHHEIVEYKRKCRVFFSVNCVLFNYFETKRFEYLPTIFYLLTMIETM